MMYLLMQLQGLSQNKTLERKRLCDIPEGAHHEGVTVLRLSKLR